MADMATMAGSTREVSMDPPAREATVEHPLFRTVGYCAGCGTWDEHGPVCVSCGYEFMGDDSSSANL